MPDTADLLLRLTPAQRRIIENLAQRYRVSAETAVLRAVEQAHSAEPSSFPEGTPFHGFDRDLADLGTGPDDLSTNREHLDDLGR